MVIMRSATGFFSGLTFVCLFLLRLSLLSPFCHCYNFRQEQRVTNRKVGFINSFKLRNSIKKEVNLFKINNKTV
jgi:hypothetical protein